MRVLHNGTEKRLETSGAANLAEVLVGVLAEEGAESRALTRLCVDGHELPEPEPAELEAISLDDVDEIVVESKPLREVALSALASAADYTDQLQQATLQTATLLRGGQVEDANRLYANVIDAFTVLLYTLSASSQALREEAAELQGIDAEIQPWLEALLDAQEQRDWVRVADYLEHEVEPILQTWRRRIRKTRETCGVACDVAEGGHAAG